MKKIFQLSSLFIFFIEFVYGQQFVLADPYQILNIEKEQFSDSTIISNLLIRPIINSENSRDYNIKARSEFYFNDDAPNFENMGNRFIGKGAGLFTGINISYIGKYMILSLEPFYISNQNKGVMNLGRDNIFGRLNDAGFNIGSPYKSFGLRETQLYLHYKSLAIGYSNANMWWGPGIHSSLTMTNNTTGFPHFMIGTLKEKKINNIGINFRYIFSILDKTIGDPYFTALVWTLRFYTDPIVTIGLSRNYLSGGLPTDRPFTVTDAAFIIFEELLIDTKIKKYPSDWEEHDPWDELMSGFLMLDFPLSKLRLYAEFGTNDHRQNFSDLRAQPDHSSAYVIGMRKYGVFNNKHFLTGLEYTNLILGKFWTYRPTPNWYDKDYYDYSSYDGRRWAAHSGSDSDDLYIYFGYNDDKISIIPAFNYERHGVLYSRPPEVKMEIRLDIRYKWNDYKFNIYFEREWLEHAGFISNEWRNGNVIWFGIERDITNVIFNKI